MPAASSCVLIDCPLEEWANGTGRVNFSAEGDDAKIGAEPEYDTSGRPLSEPEDTTDKVDGRRAIRTRSSKASKTFQQL